MLGFTKKQYSENFVFLNLRIPELFAREVCIFLKKQAILFYCFCMFVNKHFINRGGAYLKK